MAGPSTSKHTAKQAQTRWNGHEQGQGQGERRLAWGQAKEGNAVAAAAAVYCGKNVITSRISDSDKYQWVILVVRWGECSPIVEGIMKVLAPSGLSG